MNYDKKLAKYAKQLRNPKYFDKILDILEKAEDENYEFKDFNDYDLNKITGEINEYYEAVSTEKDHKKMVKYCNSYWFVLSDKNLILYEAENLLFALTFYVKANLLLIFARIKQSLAPDKWLEVENVTKDLFLCRGALKAAKFLECEIFDLEERKINFR